jgi:hypothetical protein
LSDSDELVLCSPARSRNDNCPSRRIAT